MSQTISVRSPEASYWIHIGAGVLDRVAEVADKLGLGRQVIVATDSTVAPLHGARVRAALQAGGYGATLVVLPAGEQHKNWATLDTLIDECAAAGLDRSGWLLALGGGVIGDSVGLGAALYMRGIPLVQAPTTLLAMVDASIGGKVAIDHRRGKNLVGVFKQPAAVLVDPAVLVTLPPDEVANGMAEVVKAAIIGDSPGDGPGAPQSPLLALVEAGAQPSETMLALAIGVKRRVVEADPYEHGIRALLNLGHTFGHAFELLSGYTLKHGYGVAMGMMTAAHLAASCHLAPPALAAHIARLLTTYRLPLHWGATLPPATPPAAVLAAMATDKKRHAGRLRLVLARAVGDVRVETDIPEAAILTALAATYE